MKTIYKKEAWLLDDDILIHGYVDKWGFHPQKDIVCGFDSQKINKKDKGKTLFYRLGDALSKLDLLCLAGGQIRFAIDDGLTETKVLCSCGNILCGYTTNTITTKDNIKTIIDECLVVNRIVPSEQTKLVWMLTSESGAHSLEMIL